MGAILEHLIGEGVPQGSPWSAGMGEYCTLMEFRGLNYKIRLAAYVFPTSLKAGQQQIPLRYNGVKVARVPVAICYC